MGLLGAEHGAAAMLNPEPFLRDVRASTDWRLIDRLDVLDLACSKLGTANMFGDFSHAGFKNWKDFWPAGGGLRMPRISSLPLLRFRLLTELALETHVDVDTAPPTLTLLPLFIITDGLAH